MSNSKARPSLRAAFGEWWRDLRSRNGIVSALGMLVAEMWAFALDSTPQRERQRYGDVDYDWDYRVNTTSAAVGWRNRLLGVFHSPYQPTEPGLFREMLDSLGIDFAKFTFIDIGSGKGRTLLLASEYPFRKVVGVELLPELSEIARENIRAFKSEKRQCSEVESVCGDAREFVFPNEPLLVYLFNPLTESGLTQVAGNLEQSVKDCPRPVFVLYHNPLLADVFERSQFFSKTADTGQYAVYRVAPQDSEALT